MSAPRAKLGELRDLPALLSVAEALRLLPVGRGTLYDAIRRGDVPSVRVGGRVLIPTARLLRECLGVEVDL